MEINLKVKAIKAYIRAHGFKGSKIMTKRDGDDVIISMPMSGINDRDLMVLFIVVNSYSISMIFKLGFVNRNSYELCLGPINKYNQDSFHKLFIDSEFILTLEHTFFLINDANLNDVMQILMDGVFDEELFNLYNSLSPYLDPSTPESYLEIC